MASDAPSNRPGADVDAWIRQSQTLEDLAKFVEAHGPRTKAPLPVLNWTMGAFRAISAELPTFESDADRLATLDAYARALGAVVSRRTAKDRTVYTVRGRIGRPEGTDRQPRTSVIIQAAVWREIDDEQGAGIQTGTVDPDLAQAAQDFDDPSMLDAPTVPADLAGFPWRVYGLPRLGDGGQPWLVNAFTTRQGAEDFAEKHPDEYGPMTIVDAEPARACGKCGQPFDPTDNRFDGRAEERSMPGYCRGCVDRCHDSEDAFHVCVICRPAERGQPDGGA